MLPALLSSSRDKMAGTLRFTSEGEFVGPTEKEHQEERIEYHKGKLRLLSDEPYSMSSLISTVYSSVWLRYHRNRLAHAKLKEWRNSDTYGKLRRE